MAPAIEVASRRVRVAALLLIAGLAAGPVGTHVYWMLGGTWGLHSSTSTGIRVVAAVVVVLLVAAVLVVLARVGLWQQAFVSDRLIRFFAWALAAVFLVETLAAFTWSRGVRVVAVRARLARDRSARARRRGLGRQRGLASTGRTGRCPRTEGGIVATRTLPVPAPPPVEPSVGDGAVIRAEHLTKRFGDVLAVDDLSFALERGTVTGFLGPNGAGKTTTLRMLLHLVQPTAGQALVFGGRYQDLERPASRVGAVLEAADFHPGRSGRDHLFSLALALGALRRRQLVPRARAGGAASGSMRCSSSSS